VKVRALLCLTGAANSSPDLEKPSPPVASRIR
jgi:hypothetical protein